jgi:uncharacterized protein YecT (DUF1311 family)
MATKNCIEVSLVMMFAARKAALIVAMAAPVALTGCLKPETTCSSEEGLSVVKQILLEEAERQLVALNKADNDFSFTAEKVKSQLNQLTLAIDGIRTDLKDPASSKKHCQGFIKVSAPESIISSASSTRRFLNMSTVSELASEYSFDQTGNVFSRSIEYTVQPTDDGKQIVASLSSTKRIAEFLQELISSSIVNSVLEENLKAQDQAAEDRRIQKEEADRAAAEEQKAAALEKAKHDNLISHQVITEVWNSIPDDEKKLLAESQRSWEMKRNANCKIAAAEHSTDASSREAFRLSCETDETQKRIAELKQSLQ